MKSIEEVLEEEFKKRLGKIPTKEELEVLKKQSLDALVHENFQELHPVVRGVDPRILKRFLGNDFLAKTVNRFRWYLKRVS